MCILVQQTGDCPFSLVPMATPVLAIKPGVTHSHASGPTVPSYKKVPWLCGLQG